MTRCTDALRLSPDPIDSLTDTQSVCAALSLSAVCPVQRHSLLSILIALLRRLLIVPAAAIRTETAARHGARTTMDGCKEGRVHRMAGTAGAGVMTSVARHSWIVVLPNICRNIINGPAQQPPSVEVGLAAGGGAAQGGAIGALMATFSAMEPPPTPGMPAPPKPPGMVGGPMVLGRNFAVMTGVNAGLGCAIKKARGGVDDVQGSMAASFGAGAAFSVVSTLGAPPGSLPGPMVPAAILADAVRTGLVFSLLQGAFYQVGTMFSPKPGQKQEEELAYMHTRGMLVSLGLQEYEKNFKKGLLNDATLPLLTDSALAEVRIPPGPRLRILQHVTAARAAASRGTVGKPANASVGALSLALPLLT